MRRPTVRRARLLAGGSVVAVAVIAALVLLLTHRGGAPASAGAGATVPGGAASATPSVAATSSASASATSSPAAGTPAATHAPLSPRPAATPTARPLQTMPPGGFLGPSTSLHYAANGNWSGATYVPGATGFTLADISDPGMLASLPPGTRALAYVGQCDGTHPGSAFLSAVQGFHASPQLFGFYLMDEPHPASCSAANLMAEADWVHTNIPGARTFIVLENQSATKSPTYQGTYNPGDTHVDLYGLDPYPCRTELNGCSDGWIPLAVRAAESAGVPLADIVPVYQAFGGGGWADDGGGHYMLPSAQQEVDLLAEWAAVVPTPVFDYCYSWGSQNGDTALAQSSALQAVIRRHNSG